MRKSALLTWFSSITALLTLIYAAAGFFSQGGSGAHPFTSLRGDTVLIYGQGLYQNDTLLTAAGFRGGDAVTIFIVVPLLIISILLYRRESLRGVFLLLGGMGYCLYQAATYATAAAYNDLFLVYILALTSSLFAFVLSLKAIDIHTLEMHIKPGMPRKGIAYFMLIAGGVTAVLWLSLILGPLVSGDVPDVLGSYTTIVTFTLDLGIITPAALLAGILLLRRSPSGYVAAFPLLILLALVGFSVISQTIFQINAGIQFSTGQFIGLIGSWVVLAAFAIGLSISFLLHLKR